MKNRSKFIQFLPTLISILGIIVILEVASHNTIKPAILATPFPAPNGYDDLVAAGKLVSTNSADVAGMNAGDLRQVVAQDGDALSRARLGMSRGCRAPLDLPADLSAHIGDLASLKALARAFEAEGRLAEMEKPLGNAAQSYLDIIRLGVSSGRGGVLGDQMVGTAIEGIGTKHLDELAGRLDAASCRETTATLEILDAQRQPWQQVLLQERYWVLKTYPGINNRLSELFNAGSIKRSRRDAEAAYDKQVEETRVLLVSLAARAYQLDKGHAPATLDALVPDYLKAVPQNPITGKPIAFNP